MNRPLLFLSHRLPYPPHNGAAIRTYNIIRILATRFDLRMLCFDRVDSALRDQSLEARISALSAFGQVRVFDIPQQVSRFRFFWDHVRSLVSGNAYTHYVHSSAAFRDAVDAALGDLGESLCHVDSLDLVSILPRLPANRVALTHHNIESSLLRRRGEALGFPAGPYLAHQATLVEKEEIRWGARVALNVTVSAQDEAMLRALAPGARTVVVPNGVDTSFFTPAGSLGSEILFTGGLNYQPNRDAIAWMLRNVLPRIRQKDSRRSLTVVGRVTSRERAEFEDTGLVRFTGYVDDIRPHLARAGCFVAPLQSGGGTRLKILDAWGMGLPVVSTSIGCEGLEAIDGTNILVRDDPEDFADAVHDVLTTPELQTRIATGGRRTAETVYDWSVLGKKVLDAYESLAGSR